jgi:hypothetical protein
MQREHWQAASMWMRLSGRPRPHSVHAAPASSWGSQLCQCTTAAGVGTRRKWAGMPLIPGKLSTPLRCSRSWTGACCLLCPHPCSSLMPPVPFDGCTLLHTGFASATSFCCLTLPACLLCPQLDYG